LSRRDIRPLWFHHPDLGTFTSPHTTRIDEHSLIKLDLFSESPRGTEKILERGFAPLLPTSSLVREEQRIVTKQY
jgi:hypothetical protein